MVELYNNLDGKNLCNIFASVIVNKINDSCVDAITEITVVNVRSFFIIKGKTSSTIVLNLSDIIRDFYEKLNKDVGPIKVFDLIFYGENNIEENLYIEHKEKKYPSLIKKSSLDELKFNLKIDNKNKFLFFDCDRKASGQVLDFLISKFDKYKIINSDFSNEIYISDRVYGLSNDEKYYNLLLMYITNHLFMKGISTMVDFCIYKIGDSDVNFKINGGEFIVKQEWLESLILDVFPFNLVILKTKFNLDMHSCETNEDFIYEWKRLDLLNELLLV
jgi:hypothetical protein